MYYLAATVSPPGDAGFAHRSIYELQRLLDDVEPWRSSSSLITSGGQTHNILNRLNAYTCLDFNCAASLPISDWCH